MIQFDGHIFLDGLNAPTRWCFVLDFFKKASPAPRYVCWRNPAWHSKWKGFHKNTRQILSSIRKAFGTSHAARFVQSWIHGKMIQLETKLTWTLFFLLRWSKHYLFLSLNEHRCFWQFQFDVPTEKAGAWKGEWRELPVSPIDCEMGSDEHSYCWCFRNLAQPVYPGLFTRAFFYTVGMYKTS